MENMVELKEFLNFLSLACKVNLKEGPENTISLNTLLQKLTSNPLILNLFEHCQCAGQIELNPNKKVGCSKRTSTADSLDTMKNSTIQRTDFAKLNEVVKLLKGKLLELLNEGIFDSILPYITSSTINHSTDVKLVENDNKITATSRKQKREKKKKSIEHNVLVSENEAEVEIHVYDEVKGLKKDFKCPPKLLVSHMEYFSEITKGQKLEEMDITVHCDISIFEWLLKWLKRNSVEANTCELPPRLDYKNVVPIMVSANFLQMKQLFEDCIHFCKYNLNDVIKFSTNLNCLSDDILIKLAAILSNTEVQNLRDRKDKIKSRLFCKLIMSLNNEQPQKHQGHYASSAYLYFCLHCSKLVAKVSAPHVSCRVQYITIRYNGDVIFNHCRDPKWNINDHIKSIWSEYKSWSSIYWRLWSQCHFLYCDMCRTMYAVAFADCCPYHPQQPHFYPMEQFQTTNSPIGRYPCCGSKAMRYETIVIRSGCKFRSHVPKLRTNDDTCIQNLIDSFPDLIKVKWADDNVAPFVDDYDIASFNNIYKNTFVDKGEYEMNQGLLKGPLFDVYLKTIQKYKSISPWELKNECTGQKLNESYENIDCSSVGESENSDISYIQDLSFMDNGNIPQACEEVALLTTTKNDLKPAWSSRYSVRHNQDNLRDKEEIAFQAMSEILLQQYDQEKRGSKKSAVNDGTPLLSGGSYVKIESEWKESSLKMSGCRTNNKM